MKSIFGWNFWNLFMVFDKHGLRHHAKEIALCNKINWFFIRSTFNSHGCADFASSLLLFLFFGIGICSVYTHCLPNNTRFTRSILLLCSKCQEFEMFRFFLVWEMNKMVEARSLDQHRFNFKPNTFYGLGESLLQSTSGGEQAQFYAMCINC